MNYIVKKGTKRLDLFDTKTGKNIGYLDDVSINVENKNVLFYKNEKKIYSFEKNSEYTMSFSIDKLENLEEIRKILGVDFSTLPDMYSIQYPKIVRVRTHKKKRIDKKWRKRYGYKVVVANSKGWKLKCNTDGTAELIKDTGKYSCAFKLI